VDKQKLIFIADDDPVINMLVTRRLAANGYNVKSFRYGEDCIKELDADPDLIILDYYFVNENKELMNGMEVFNRIRELKPLIHVIILSGQEKGEIVLELARKGIDDYVIKDHNLIDNLIISVRDSLKRVIK
jgi:DNA-binding response OmpR family regulator